MANNGRSWFPCNERWQPRISNIEIIKCYKVAFAKIKSVLLSYIILAIILIILSSIFIKGVSSIYIGVSWNSLFRGITNLSLPEGTVKYFE